MEGRRKNLQTSGRGRKSGDQGKRESINQRKEEEGREEEDQKGEGYNE